MRTLDQDFYARSPMAVARELLGKWLIRRSREGLCAGRIVETEAYLAQDDPACHAYRGKNRKNATMFGPAGHLYVYSIHARYCLNAVTELPDVGSAVLIRAVEPTQGIDLMRRRREREDLRELSRGPARLCEAFDVDRQLDGWSLLRSTRIWIADPENGPIREEEIGISKRIGVTSAQDRELRFFVRGNPYVSGANKLHLPSVVVPR
jgi:DNA-3-methyladenine glycosylase